MGKRATPTASLFPTEERLPKIAREAMAALAKYLQRHDEQYLMDAYRLLHDELSGE